MSNKPVIDVKMKEAFQDLFEKIEFMQQKHWLEYLQKFLADNIDIPISNYHYVLPSFKKYEVGMFDDVKPYLPEDWGKPNDFILQSGFDAGGKLLYMTAMPPMQDTVDALASAIEQYAKIDLNIEIEPMFELYDSGVSKWGHRLVWDPGIVGQGPIYTLDSAIGQPEEIKRVRYQDPIFPYRLNICLHENLFNRVRCWIGRNVLFEMCSKWRV